MKRKLLIFSMIAGLTVSCNDSGDSIKVNPSEEQKTSKYAAGGESEEELRKAAEEKKKQKELEEKERKAKLTSMEVSPKEHDFGRIPKETPVSKTFKVTNTGDKPLVIQEASASCGCTVPKKPEQPIAPGESDEIEVTFTSKPNQAGQQIAKTVTITANIENSTERITIRGKVDE